MTLYCFASSHVCTWTILCVQIVLSVDISFILVRARTPVDTRRNRFEVMNRADRGARLSCISSREEGGERVWGNLCGGWLPCGDMVDSGGSNETIDPIVEKTVSRITIVHRD